MNNKLISKNIIDNLIEVMSIAVKFSAHKDAGVENFKGSLQYFSGCDFPFFNGVFNNYQHNELGIKDDLLKITDFFKSKNTPFIWWWIQQSDLPEDVKKELEDQEFKLLGEFLGIAAELKHIKSNCRDHGIQTKCVSNDVEYKKFIAIICEVFHLSDNIKRDFEEMYQSYGEGGKFKHYLGFYEGEPVATVTSYVKGEILGLYNGATLANIQKKGLCSILIQNAINEAMDLGCKYGISQLMAPGMAKGLCEKNGI